MLYENLNFTQATRREQLKLMAHYFGLSRRSQSHVVLAFTTRPISRLMLLHAPDAVINPVDLSRDYWLVCPRITNELEAYYYVILHSKR